MISLRRVDQGGKILDERESRAEREWDNMKFTEKLSDWAARHEYSVILAGWAASMGLAGGIITRDKCVPSLHRFLFCSIPSILGFKPPLKKSSRRVCGRKL